MKSENELTMGAILEHLHEVINKTHNDPIFEGRSVEEVEDIKRSVKVALAFSAKEEKLLSLKKRSMLKLRNLLMTIQPHSLIIPQLIWRLCLIISKKRLKKSSIQYKGELP